MKLNGWQRIGIVASVVWAIGAGLYSLNASHDREAEKAADHVARSCIEAYRNARGVNPPPGQCDVSADQYTVSLQSGEFVDAAIAALVPVSLGWALGYAIVWIRRGFRPVPPAEG